MKGRRCRERVKGRGIERDNEREKMAIESEWDRDSERKRDIERDIKSERDRER